MVVITLEITPEIEAVLVHVVWEMLEEEKVPSMVAGTTEKIEKKQQEIEIGKW